jgi:hypothetical protein
MNLKNLFNSYVSYGLNVRLNTLNGKEEWNKKISTEDLSLNKIPGGWVTSRIFYNGTSSSDKNDIYDYLYNKIGMKGEISDNQLPGYEQFHFLLQTARLVKNNECTVEKLAQIGYNVGQLLASIDFYSAHPLALQYISTNKLNLVSSYVSGSETPVNLLPPVQSGAGLPVIDMYKKYINMTPYKGYKMIGGCGCGQSGCDKCEVQIVNLLI